MIVVRHRFEPPSLAGQLCAFVRGEEVCLALRESEVHWADRDHPFTGDGEECDWICEDGELCARERFIEEHRPGWVSARVRVPDENGVRVASALREWPLDDSVAVSVGVAAALRNGSGEVRRGPWSVRQWVVEAGGAWPPDAGEVVRGLWETGAPYDSYVWWREDGQRVVRVLWGELLGLTEEEMCDRLG
jgi:hypothetical protein